MKRPILLLLLALPALPAQDWYPRHNFTVSGIFARPRGDIGGLLEDAGGVGFGYGYRFHRNFQAETGLDTIFGAAGVRDYLNTDFGPRRIRDYQFFVPFGGRAIIPFAGERFWISGGGGGAFMTYRERISQPSDYYRIDCYVCTARSGWGYYGLLNAGAALDQNRHFRIGATAKMYRGHTEGDPLGNVPPVRTYDKWLMLSGDFSFTF